MRDEPDATGRRYVSTLRLSPEGLVMPTPEGDAMRKLVASLDEDSCCSFDEWRESGFMVIKGSKSCFKDILGVPQFTKEQVVRIATRPPARKI